MNSVTDVQDPHLDQLRSLLAQYIVGYQLITYMHISGYSL
jgi:hypothetical protein